MEVVGPKYYTVPVIMAVGAFFRHIWVLGDLLDGVPLAIISQTVQGLKE